MRQNVFDNQEDPYQLHNLINSPKHAALQARLEKRMRELMKEAGDPGDTGKIAAYRQSRKPVDNKPGKTKRKTRKKGSPG